MAALVTVDNSTELRSNGAVIRRSTDASEIGLRPGEWPQRLETTLGNGQPFVLAKLWPDDLAIYSQNYGICELTVYND